MPSKAGLELVVPKHKKNIVAVSGFASLMRHQSRYAILHGVDPYCRRNENPAVATMEAGVQSVDRSAASR